MVIINLNFESAFVILPQISPTKYIYCGAELEIREEPSPCKELRFTRGRLNEKRFCSSKSTSPLVPFLSQRSTRFTRLVFNKASSFIQSRFSPCTRGRRRPVFVEIDCYRRIFRCRKTFQCRSGISTMLATSTSTQNMMRDSCQGWTLEQNDLAPRRSHSSSSTWICWHLVCKAVMKVVRKVDRVEQLPIYVPL